MLLSSIHPPNYLNNRSGITIVFYAITILNYNDHLYNSFVKLDILEFILYPKNIDLALIIAIKFQRISFMLKLSMSHFLFIFIL